MYNVNQYTGNNTFILKTEKKRHKLQYLMGIITVNYNIATNTHTYTISLYHLIV